MEKLAPNFVGEKRSKSNSNEKGEMDNDRF
jgi:hypothetical protein